MNTGFSFVIEALLVSSCIQRIARIKLKRRDRETSLSTQFYYCFYNIAFSFNKCQTSRPLQMMKKRLQNLKKFGNNFIRCIGTKYSPK